MTRHLVLFDVDHTLVDVLRFHEPVYGEVLRESFGIDGRLREVEFSGKTTPNILRELAAHHGVVADAIEAALPRMIVRFNSGVLARLDPDLRATVLPGVVELLRCLNARGQVMGVVTGNPPEIGRTVLERAHLLQYFSVSSFGTEARGRSELVALAVRRASDQLRITFKPREVVVVGDSPHDVAAGKSFGARTIAIGTGLSGWDELDAARPDGLFRDCRDFATVCASIAANAHVERRHWWKVWQ